MLHSELTEKIEFEINEIETLIKSYSSLVELCKNQEPDLIYLSALATMLHSFYNGLENIFLSISKTIDKQIPQASNWHKILLYKMGEKTENKNPVLSEETIEKLEEYLSFRHFFRHSYSYHLSWNKLKPLVSELSELWLKIKEEIIKFKSNIKNVS
ncbi:MAG: hypothetical protein A2086_14100 [Spirochaetes bacterium GWD1_27_9]|nr:MAG: hypothetical protein A2Z98_14370 [Spirochaetes bacterium GWB1_27_13]OHD22281.1 MAG: hypothetical protein A2Y34_06145 [Spirochaetes bacterium GWC1_27_15]OHD37777.1 MAG: hypothetical protein A2086_14100 [Spirochaetes bacterium GWD1_27_9]